MTEASASVCLILATALIFLRIYLLKYPSEIFGDGISETLNFKILCGNMPPEPPSLEHPRRSKHSSCAYNFKISRYAPGFMKKSSSYILCPNRLSYSRDRELMKETFRPQVWFLKDLVLIVLGLVERPLRLRTYSR